MGDFFSQHKLFINSKDRILDIILFRDTENLNFSDLALCGSALIW